MGRALLWKPSKPAFREATAVNLDERPFFVSVAVFNIGCGAVSGVSAEKRKHFSGVCDLFLRSSSCGRLLFANKGAAENTLSPLCSKAKLCT